MQLLTLSSEFMFALPLVSITTRARDEIGGLEPGWITIHGPVKFKKAVTPDELRQANYEL